MKGNCFQECKNISGQKEVSQPQNGHDHDKDNDEGNDYNHDDDARTHDKTDDYDGMSVSSDSDVSDDSLLGESEVT